MITEDGIKVEVKSASYLQSWKQTSHSKISFDISPTRGMDSDSITYGGEIKRQADVYVFCLLKHKDKVTVDPINLDQWEFYIVPTEQIITEKGTQKSIGLNPLIKLNPIVTDYRGIKMAVLSVIKK